MDLRELKRLPITDLMKLAQDMGVENPSRMHKQHILFATLKAHALKGEKIYLNVGRISGVQIGDILKVVEDGSEVYDPEIGYHIGKVSGNTKGTIEVVSYFGQDGAVGVIHSGAGFKENDRVELYH